MVRLIGLAAVLLIAGLPALVLAGGPLLAASVAVAAICAAGLLLPSPGLATAGTVLAVLLFAATLVLAPPGPQTLAAALLGVALLTLLHAIPYRQRVARAP